jgi:hypothetical protein
MHHSLPAQMVDYFDDRNNPTATALMKLLALTRQKI